MVKGYIPKQGDIVYVDFEPTKGHEQPAIVISHDVFNMKTNMVILCPITSNVKQYPTHYILEDSVKVKGAVLCEHIRSIDYDIRKVKFVEHASDNDLLNIILLTNACFD